MPSREELIETTARMLAGIGQPDDPPARRQAYFERWAEKVLDAILDRLQPDPERVERAAMAMWQGDWSEMTERSKASWRVQVARALDAAGQVVVTEGRFLGKTAEEWFEIVGQKAESEDRLITRARAAEAKLAEAEAWAHSSENPAFDAGWEAGKARGLAEREAVDLTEEEIRALRFLASRVQCFDVLLGVDGLMRALILSALGKLQRLSEMGS